MRITLTDAGKRFNRDWIFRHLSYEFISGRSYAITGPNGSGKSTLLQIIGGAVKPSEGDIHYYLPQESVSKIKNPFKPVTGNVTSAPLKKDNGENIYSSLSFSAPYLELIEEMTLVEFLSFHQLFKPFFPLLNVRDIIHLVQLDDAAHKQIRYFSSGMKQRAKLAQAIFSDTPLLLLDEPCTNLDQHAVELYQDLIMTYGKDRIVIVGSNDVQEYEFCETEIAMQNYRSY